MKKKQLLSVIVIVLNFNLLCQTKDSIFNVNVSQQISLQEVNDQQLSKAIASLSSFLFNRDKSLVYTSNSIDSNYINFIFENLFIYNSLDNKYLSYYIFESEKNKEFVNSYNITFLLKHDFSLYGEEYKNEFILYYVYEAIMIKKNDEYLIDIRPRISSVKKVKSISYYYSKNNVKNKKNIANSKRFLKELEKKYLFKQKKELRYYVNNRKDSFSPFGFSFHELTTSMFSSKNNFLITTDSQEDNFHELTHYYFQDFKLGKFLSEGIAVYYGGSNGNSKELFFEKEKNKFNLLVSTLKSKYVNDFLLGRFYGGEYQPFFYAMSGEIISNYLKNHNEIQLKHIIENNGEISPNSFIQKHLKTQNTEEYIWKLLTRE